MRANELRIGNLILDNKEVKKVTSGMLSNWDIIKRDYGGYNPIPLTEEWLTNLSYKKWKNKKIWTFKGVMIYQMADGNFYYGRKSSRVKVSTVHQLQNLYFALTGEEIELSTDIK